MVPLPWLPSLEFPTPLQSLGPAEANSRTSKHPGISSQTPSFTSLSARMISLQPMLTHSLGQRLPLIPACFIFLSASRIILSLSRESVPLPSNLRTSAIPCQKHLSLTLLLLQVTFIISLPSIKLHERKPLSRCPQYLFPYLALSKQTLIPTFHPNGRLGCTQGPGRTSRCFDVVLGGVA